MSKKVIEAGSGYANVDGVAVPVPPRGLDVLTAADDLIMTAYYDLSHKTTDPAKARKELGDIHRAILAVRTNIAEGWAPEPVFETDNHEWSLAEIEKIFETTSKDKDFIKVMKELAKND